VGLKLKKKKKGFVVGWALFYGSVSVAFADFLKRTKLRLSAKRYAFAYNVSRHIFWTTTDAYTTSLDDF